MSVTDNVQVVITRKCLDIIFSQSDDSHLEEMRAENVTVGLERVPVGFYVQVDIDGYPYGQQTENKSMWVSDRVIQWDDVIRLYGTVNYLQTFVYADTFQGPPTHPP